MTDIMFPKKKKNMLGQYVMFYLKVVNTGQFCQRRKENIYLLQSVHFLGTFFPVEHWQLIISFLWIKQSGRLGTVVSNVVSLYMFRGQSQGAKYVLKSHDEVTCTTVIQPVSRVFSHVINNTNLSQATLLYILQYRSFFSQ